MGKEVSVIYISAKQMIANGDIFGVRCDSAQNQMCSVLVKVNEFINTPNIKYAIEQGITRFNRLTDTYISSFVMQLPRRLLELFIMFFIVFYLFKDGKLLVDKLGEWLPIKKKYQEHIIQQFKDVMWAVVYGILVVAVSQGVLGGIGFFISGVILYKTTGIYSSILLGSPIFWGIMMALFAMIPVVGTWVVWLPVGFGLLATGISTNNPNMVGVSIGLLLYCLVIVSTIDNFLKPHIIGSRAKIHPAVVMLGIFGGLLTFGITGIFIGPIVLGILATFIKIYEKERNELVRILP
jgi:predicted PurR-regulated permease PerM